MNLDVWVFSDLFYTVVANSAIEPISHHFPKKCIYEFMDILHCIHFQFVANFHLSKEKSYIKNTNKKYI